MWCWVNVQPDGTQPDVAPVCIPDNDDPRL